MTGSLVEGQQVKVRTPISQTWRDATVIGKATSNCYRIRFNDNAVTAVVSRTRIRTVGS